MKLRRRIPFAVIAVTTTIIFSTCCSVFALGPLGAPVRPWNSQRPAGGTAPATVVYMYDEQWSGSALSASITGYSTADGSVVSELDLPLATYYYGPFTTDATGHIYVATPANQVLVYAPGATGAATPERTIQLQISNNIVVTNLAVDPMGYLYVVMRTAGANGGYAINVYSPTANSFASPVRTLQLENILIPLNDIAADAQGNIYLAACWSSKSTWGWVVAIYPPKASGPSVPRRMIQFDHNTWANGVAVDARGHIFVSVDQDVRYYPTLAIEEFDSNLRGPARPIKTIDLPAVANIWGFGGPVRLDGAGNILTAAMQQELSSSKSLVVFGYPPTATGDATPAYVLNGAWNVNSQIVFGLN